VKVTARFPHFEYTTAMVSATARVIHYHRHSKNEKTSARRLAQNKVTHINHYNKDSPVLRL